MRRAGDNIKDEANDFGEAVEPNLDRESTELPGGKECYLHGKKKVLPLFYVHVRRLGLSRSRCDSDYSKY